MSKDKKMSLDEVKELITPTPNKNGNIHPNRFSKKNFELFVLAVLNDPDYVVKIGKHKNNEIAETEIYITKQFRKWLVGVLASFGVDSNEAKTLLTDEYQFTNVKGFYDLMAAIIYDYMEIGNKFDFHTKKDFNGSISIREMEENTKVYNPRNPRTNEKMGQYETKRKKHKELSVKSSCPKWLQEKRKLK